MTAYVFGTTTIGASTIYASAAINDSVTFLQGQTFFSTNNNGVDILHGNNTVYNMGSIMSGVASGLVVNGVNDCEIVNTATGTIASLSVSGDSAVYLWGDRNSLLNMGDVFSASGPGVTLIGDDSIIDNRGFIQGKGFGVQASGIDYTILNSGTIESGTGYASVAVSLDGSGNSKVLVNTGVIQSLVPEGGIAVRVVGSNLTTIQNSGTIRSVGGEAINAGNATGAIHLTNSGTISSSTLVTYSVVGTGQADTILNTGSINRSVALGNGDDLFDGIGGFVGGTVYGGDGNDVFRISDPLAQVFETTGQGLLDRIESTVSFSLVPTGEVENLTLLGTATDGTGNGLGNLINGNGMDNRLLGEIGLDTLIGGDGNDWIDGGTEVDQLFGGTGDDRQMGRAGNDTIDGGDGDDWLFGGGQNDSLVGGNGEDRLIGGAGRDIMAGGEDADSFVFRSRTDSGITSATYDHINGFQAGLDVLDLSSIDAIAGLAGNQAFSWLGTGAFTGAAGQLRYFLSGATLIIEGNVNADLVVDFQIRLNGMAAFQVDDVIL